MPKNRGSVFRTNEYLAEYIQNQAPLVLPYRSKIYHPSTAPFVNSDVFMKQPYYIIHASLGFKDQPVYSNYLAGHAKDQQFHKQKKSGKESKEKIPRTLSYNSHMNAEASLAFYPTNNKVSPKPVLGQIGSYSDNNKRFPMSASHGRLVNLGEKFRNFNVSSPTIENSVPSRTNFIREDKEEERETWDNKIYQQEPDFLLPKFMHWQSNDGQMIPSALKAQFSLKKTMSMKDCTASDFHSHFENKLSNGTKTKEKSEIFESNTDLAKWNENHNFIDAKSGPINVLKNPTLH